MHASTGRPTRTRGFTFLELMAVIAILATLTAVVVGNMDGLMVSSQLSYAAKAFGTELIDVRDIARLQNREIFIEIDLDNSRWRVVDVPSPSEVPDPDEREDATFYSEWFVPDPGIHLDEIAFGRDDVRSSGKHMLSFGANGEVVPGGFVAFFLHEELEEEEGISVELTGITGQVAYHPGRIEPEETREEDDF